MSWSILSGLSGLSGPEVQTPLARPERFTAIAVPPGTSGSPTPIDIVVERWSTPEENNRVMAAVKEVGTKAVLATLQKLPRVGSFATTGAAGYPLHYAWRTKGADGIEYITLATDRSPSFAEASYQTRSSEYPVTIVEIRLKPSGQGDGRVAVAAQIGVDPITKAIVIENFDTQLLLLNNVKRSR